MRQSTKEIYKEVETMHRKFNRKANETYYGERTFESFTQAYCSYVAIANDLHDKAETEAAHKKISDFVTYIAHRWKKIFNDLEVFNDPNSIVIAAKKEAIQ